MDISELASSMNIELNQPSSLFAAETGRIKIEEPEERLLSKERFITCMNTHEPFVDQSLVNEGRNAFEITESTNPMKLQASSMQDNFEFKDSRMDIESEVNLVKRINHLKIMNL